MRTTAWIFVVLLIAPAVYGDLRPLVSKAKIVAVGEEHSRPELREFYPKLLRQLKSVSRDMNCLYVEIETAAQPSLDEFWVRGTPALQALREGVRAVVDKWGLKDKNPVFSWSNSVAATVDNLNISDELMRVARQLGVKMIAVDEQSRVDYLATVLQRQIEGTGDEAQAREIMANAGFKSELPSHAEEYFRNEIVLRRSRRMAENVAQTLEGGQCRGGLFVAGSLHMDRTVEGADTIYQNGGLTVPEVLRERGIATYLMPSRMLPR